MKRPWKVNWYSPKYNEDFIKSFHYEANAREYAKNLAYYGSPSLDVRLWMVEEDGRSTKKIEKIDGR